ncbi:conserved hypothetical protein [Burkholderia cenocepacia PC184]|nr:conserved hypothetical protein [Burkholderia cenocepacia PC184]
MTYAVKEIFYTLQGEGANAGRPAVFCRFAGCNLWSGREEDRAEAVCRFCDTDFVGTDGENGGKFKDAAALVATIAGLWPEGEANRFVVCTGGEPMLQLDQPLVDALHAAGFEIAIETNGSLPVLESIDWICVSPKADAPLVVTKGNELKGRRAAGQPAAGRLREARLRVFSRAADGRPVARPQHEARDRLVQSVIRSGGCRCRPTNI